MSNSATLLSLPEECLTLILDRTTEKRTRTLYNLLTVCKALFEISVRLLYFDPVRSLTSSCSVIKFMELVLWLTPSTDTRVKGLQGKYVRCFDRVSIKPYVNYLSLVRVFREWQSVPGSENGSFTDMRYLTLAVCGHRLSRVREISISCLDLGVYTDHIQHIVNVSRIDFILERESSNSSLSVVTTTAQIEAAVGFTKKLLKKREAAGVKHALEVELLGTARDDCRWFISDDWTTAARELYALGKQPVRVYSIKSQVSPDGIRFLAQPKNLDLSPLKTFHQKQCNQTGLCAKGRKSSFIQQCPCLQSLKLDVEEGDRDVFAWAAAERRRLLSVGDSQPTAPMAAISIPPIRHLRLKVGSEVAQLPFILNDAQVAFGTTLSSLKISTRSPWTMPSLSLPQLDKFHGYGPITFTPSAFEGMTSLTTLKLFDNTEYTYPQVPDNTEHPYPQVPDNTGQAYPQVPDTQMLSSPLAKTLKILSLEGSPAYLFNQDLFSAFADRLQHIIFKTGWIDEYTMWWEQFSWDVANWNFPSLRSVYLDGAFAHMFRISMLSHSPAIESLRLHFPAGDYEPQARLSDCFFPLKATGEPLDEGPSRQPSQLSFDSLHDLCVVAYEISNDLLEVVMPSLFPKLNRFRGYDCWAERCDLRQLFPSLTIVVWEGSWQGYDEPSTMPCHDSDSDYEYKVYKKCCDPCSRAS